MEIVSEHHTEEGAKSDSATAGTVMRTRKKVEAFLKAAAGTSRKNAPLTLRLPALPPPKQMLPPVLLTRIAKLAPNSRPAASSRRYFCELLPAYASPPS